MIIYLSRHGKTDWNADEIMGGYSDCPRICGEGITQALRTVDYIVGENVPIREIFSSPLTRAIQTVNPLAKTLRNTPICFDELMEMNLGLYEGFPYRHGQEIMEAQDHDLYRRYPGGGECYDDLVKRVSRVIDPLRLLNRGNYYVQAHYLTNRVILAMLLNLDFYKKPELMTKIKVDNSVIYKIDTVKFICSWHDVLSGTQGDGLLYCS